MRRIYGGVCDWALQHSGRFMAPSVSRGRGQAGGEARRTVVARSTNPWEVLEGVASDVTNITMIEFPSMEHARAWYNDPEYAPMKRLRQAGSRLNFLLVEGSN
jgi:uncharacterized protein (DUF1330 family)